MQTLELKIPPPIATVLVGIAMWLAARQLPALPVASSFRFGMAGLCSVIALLFAVSAFRSFRKARTTISPVNPQNASSIVTGGVYRYTRNPMYVGLTALLIGWAAILAAPWTLLGPFGFALFTDRFQIVPEERILSSKFGRAYDDYRKQVRRWL
jgi:protein-S-isoprenylcysteine O-methyltransferase Ste14